MARHWTYREEKVRAGVLRRDNWECQIRMPGCLGTANEVDHIVAKVFGGRGTADNLQAACRPCNRRKGESGEHGPRLVTRVSTSHYGVSTVDYTRKGER